MVQSGSSNVPANYVLHVTTSCIWQLKPFQYIYIIYTISLN